jgi:hypothetical protein
LIAGPRTIDGRIDQDADGIGDNTTGWNGTEYELFSHIPLFIDGNNANETLNIGTANIAFDCHNLIFCAAAHLSDAYLRQNPVNVSRDDAESFIRVGSKLSDPKLVKSNSLSFTYVVKPPSVSPFTDYERIIGYEGCWNAAGLTVMNNFIEVHFMTDARNTVSTGKNTKNGKTICIDPKCPSVFLQTGFLRAATHKTKGDNLRLFW